VASASDILLRPDFESLLVPVFRELQVHLADAAVVRDQRIRGRPGSDRRRRCLRCGRHHEPPLRPGSGGSFRLWSMLLPVGQSPGSRSARNCVMSMTLYRYRSSPGFHLFSWCRHPKCVRHFGHAVRRLSASTSTASSILFRVSPFVLSLQYIIWATPQHCASPRKVFSSTRSALSTRLISSRGSSQTGSIGICRPERHGSWNATRIRFAVSGFG